MPILSLLYLTYCSRKKNPIAAASPEQLYSSRRISDFISLCKSNGLSWAILSAKYGLFFPEEIHDYYDVTFRTVAGSCGIVEDGRMLSEKESERRINDLIERIDSQMSGRKINSIIFFVDRPLVRKKCYLFVLHAAVDHCNIHKKWNEIAKHIKSMYKSGKGRIRLIVSLDEI